MSVELPRNFVRPCLLLLLREQPAHGYELLERLRPLGFTRDDPGRLYRALRALEQDGLVRSAWQPSSGGPDRRIYELTRRGTEELHRHATSVEPEPGFAGISRVHPVGGRVELHRRRRDRERRHLGRPLARLDQRYPAFGVLRQPRGDHRSRRSAADHNKIVLVRHGASPCFMSPGRLFAAPIDLKDTHLLRGASRYAIGRD